MDFFLVMEKQCDLEDRALDWESGDQGAIPNSVIDLGQVHLSLYVSVSPPALW